MRSAALLLAINYEGFSTLIPGKLYEYWATGGPPILLLSCPGAAQELVEREGLGIVAPHDDATAIERAVREVYRRSAAGAPLRISTAGIEKYDRRVLARHLAEVLYEVAVA